MFESCYLDCHCDLVEGMVIDPNWIIRRFSDGQRRCDQIHIGLIQPFKFPLFENITMSIDVCLRQYLPRWIKKIFKET